MAAARARGAIVGIEPAAEELEVCEDDEDEEVEVEEEAMDDDVAVLELVVGCEAGLADADAEDVADADPKERVEPETIRLDPDTEAEGRMAVVPAEITKDVALASTQRLESEEIAS